MNLDIDIVKALDGFNLTVKLKVDNEVLGILGASGCGKSMTLKCIAGIETPDKGHIILNNRVLFDSAKHINLPPQKRRVGYLFQSYALFPNMTVAENIGFALSGRPDKASIVQKYIEKLRLQGMEDKLPGQISGGQQQRTALARMLAVETDIIMFDEPLSALDSYLKWELEQELSDQFAEYNRPVLYVSHDRGEVFRLCRRIAVMEHGKIALLDYKRELFEHPETVTGTLLTGCKNISAARWQENGKLWAKDWGIGFTVPDSKAVGIAAVGVRAHFFEIATAKFEDNVFSMVIEKIIEDVFDWIILLRPSEGAIKLLRWEIRKTGPMALKEGQSVHMTVKAHHILLLKS